MDAIKKLVYQCKRCKLHEDKINYVFGEGNEKADIVFIGEAPGSNEDKTGRPFVGKAGKILDELLQSIGLNRGDVYICNVLKCRPSNNRNPKEDEITACTPYLLKQLEIINPKIICCLGNFATKFIMERYGLKNKIEGVTKIHGKSFYVTNLNGNINILPMYHPAFALYAPEIKEGLKKDFQALKNVKTTIM